MSSTCARSSLSSVSSGPVLELLESVSNEQIDLHNSGSPSSRPLDSELNSALSSRCCVSSSSSRPYYPFIHFYSFAYSLHSVPKNFLISYLKRSQSVFLPSSSNGLIMSWRKNLGRNNIPSFTRAILLKFYSPIAKPALWTACMFWQTSHHADTASLLEPVSFWSSLSQSSKTNQ